MIERLTKLLSILGVTATGDALLPFVLETALWKVKDMANLQELPEPLEQMSVRMAAGLYLQMKKAAGSLSMGNLDLATAAVKSLTEGDTTVSFDGTPEQRLDALILTLSEPDRALVYRYRRLSW